MQSILPNLHAVVKNPALNLTDELEISTEPTSIVDFKSLIAASTNKTSSVCFHLGPDEYTAGRLSVRLERIAEKKFGLSLTEAHKVMNPLIEKLLQQLQKDLPAAKIGTDCVYYQEVQKKIMSCAIHAINNYLGTSQLDVEEREKVASINLDETTSTSGAYSEQTCALAAGRNYVRVSLQQLLATPTYDCFLAKTSLHGIIYRKDAQGQWWKIDSLHKVGPYNYQVPVALELEKKQWADSESVTLLLTAEEFLPFAQAHVIKENTTLLAYKDQLQEYQKQLQTTSPSSENLAEISTFCNKICEQICSTHFLLNGKNIAPDSYDKLLAKAKQQYKVAHRAAVNCLDHFMPSIVSQASLQHGIPLLITAIDQAAAF